MTSQRLDDFRQEIPGWTVISLSVLFGLQLIRVLLSSLVGYLRDSQGMDALNLAPLALGIFATSFLAGLLRRAAGPRLAIWITGGGLGLVRLAEQVSTSPSLDLVLSASGVALFLLSIPIFLAVTRAGGMEGTTRFGFAFLLGVALDAAIHIGARTLDLSWQPGILPIGIIALLVAGLFGALSIHTREIDSEAASDTSWRRSLALTALGPWLFLQLLVYQNVARVSALTGWETPAAGALVVLGNALGLAAAVWMIRRSLNPPVTATVCGLLLTGSLIYAEPTSIPAVLLLLAGQILSLLLAMLLFGALGQDVTGTGLGRTTVAHGGGQILFILFVFLYYVSYEMTLGFRAPTLLPVAALFVGVGAVVSTARRSEPHARWASYWPAVAGLVLLIVPLALALAWHRLETIQPDPTNRSVRVIDYNLHNGFNTDGRLDMEALAKIIEESGADVVGLQEISRGWLIWGGLDMLTWLSQRLGMPYVTGPTGDAQWGNAILSRYPIVRAETFPLPPETLDLRRGYIVAEIHIGAGRVSVVDTHFTHRSDHDEIRKTQAGILLSAWNGAPTTIIVGDLNADPDSEAMQLLSDAGLVNVAAEIGTLPIHTSPADNPRRQIDYIWTSPDLGFSDLEIVNSTASDHLPVIATITLP